MNEPKHSSLSSITSFNDKEIRCRLDLIKFVNYGISKDMIQQVLTVIEQYTPIYLYHKGIFHPEVVLGKSLKDDDNISNDDIKTCFDFRFNSKDSIHKSITQTLKKSCNDFSEEKKGQISLLQKERKNLMVCTSKKLLEIDPLIFKARNYIPDILIAHRLNTELIKSEDVKIICLVYSYFYIKDLRNTVNHAGDTREKNSKLDIVNKKHIIETIDNHLSLLKSM